MSKDQNPKFPNSHLIDNWLRICRHCGKAYHVEFKVVELDDGRIATYQFHHYECNCIKQKPI